MEVASGTRLLAAGGLGTAQGVANTADGVQDGVVGTVNLIPMAINKIEGNPVPYLPSPDWSRDLIVSESGASHDASEFLGGTGAWILLGGGVGRLAGAAGAQAAGSAGAQTVRMVVQADGQLAAATATTSTAAAATQGVAVAGMGIGAIGQTVPMSAGSGPASSGGGRAPKTGNMTPFEMRASADGSKGIYGDLNDEGMIEFFIEAGPQANPRGHVLFKEMIDQGLSELGRDSQRAS
jgi:hypothetical protein